MPARDAERTIAAAIWSVLGQTYRDFELWVLENRSCDATVRVAKQFTDSRVRVFELGRVGFQGALQYALDNARSPWLARMDADDLIFPNRLERQIEEIRQRPDLVLVGTAFALLTPFGHMFERARCSESRQVSTTSLGLRGSGRRCFADASVVFRRSVALQVGGYDAEFTMSDVPLWFRMLERGVGWEIAEPLYIQRLRPCSMTYSETMPSGQGRRARFKYAGECSSGRSEPAKAGGFWHWIAALEFMAGHEDAGREALGRMSAEQVMPRDVRKAKCLARLGKLLGPYYRLRNGRAYRHRPDWEERFGPELRIEGAEVS